MAALTKQERLALPAEDFAVPSRRALPIHDAKHVQMAHRSLDALNGVSESERRMARRRILARAESLGLDTTRWSKLAASSIAIDAMALNITNGGDHPNKMPFSGILTRIGEPSDFSPGGADGKLVLLTHDAAEKALESLLGMAVDYTPSFDGHDAQAKIGIITSAEIEGNALVIEGFVYAADFPEQAAFIRANKDALGFSFEAKEIYVRDPSADPLEIVECMFTGAAILCKDKAAYQTTSLAASAEGITEMTKEEMLAVFGEALAPALAAAMAPVNDRLSAVEANAKASAEAAAKQAAAIEANKQTIEKVEPLAVMLENAAEAMEAAGVGADASRGHVTVLRKMAGSMRADAALGKMPNAYYDYSYYASREAKADPKVTELETKLADLTASSEIALTKALDEATKPLKEEIASLKTKAADVIAAARTTTPEPERKTLSPQIAGLLARTGISAAAAEGEGKLSVADVDAALTKAGITDFSQRVALKRTLESAGRM